MPSGGWLDSTGVSKIGKRIELEVIVQTRCVFMATGMERKQRACKSFLHSDGNELVVYRTVNCRCLCREEFEDL